jgi:SAM-dependent methyltransferase
VSGAPAACRSCGGDGLSPILSLGPAPLANAFLRPEELDRPEEKFALHVVWCPACSLLQITETVPPDKLFRHYAYFSSTAETMVRHAEALVERVAVERRLGARSLALEIGSNDGYLLQFYRGRGIPVLGIEPARNVAAAAQRERGVRTWCEFFNADLAARIRREVGPADVVHAHNVLGHVENLNGVVRGIRDVLKDEGLAVIEVPYVKDLLDACAFDTIYHEHLCYFSLTAADRLFEQNGLRIDGVERIDVHGGTLRLFVRRAGGTPSVRDGLARELDWGVNRAEPYLEFARRVGRVTGELRERLTEMKRAGKRLAAYGAAAKGTMLLNALGFGPETLEFVADRSPHKQGLFVPGARLPIVPPERLLESMPDAVLLLAWNLKDEIVRQQAEYRRRGGAFMVPLPELRILS